MAFVWSNACYLFLLVYSSIILCNRVQAMRCYTEGDVSLSGPESDAGPLNICINSTWFFACSDGFDDIDARIACRQLGYVEGRISNRVINDKRELYNVTFTCGGYEESLNDCVTTVQAQCPSMRTPRIQCYNGYLSFFPEVIPNVRSTDIVNSGPFNLPNGVSIPYKSNEVFNSGYIYQNGFISLGPLQITDLSSIYYLFNIEDNPYDMIAPFYLESMLPMEVYGKIYHVEETGNDTRPYSPVDAYIQYVNDGSPFNSRILLVVQWEEDDDLSSGGQKIEFQSIIASDFNDTYVIFTHKCSPGLRPFHASMGISLHNFTAYEFRYSDTPYSHEIACINSPAGVDYYTVSFKITSEITLRKYQSINEGNIRQEHLNCSSLPTEQCCTPFSDPTVSCLVWDPMTADHCYCDALCYRYGDCCEDIIRGDAIPRSCLPVCMEGTINMEGNTYDPLGPARICSGGIQLAFAGQFDQFTQNFLCQQMIDEITQFRTSPVAQSGTMQMIGSYFTDKIDLRCVGNERTISDCRQRDHPTALTPVSDLQIINCETEITLNNSICNNGDISIRRADQFLSVCLNGKWRDFCVDSFPESVLEIICTTLGLPSVYTAAASMDRDGGASVGIDSMTCPANASILADCAVDRGDCATRYIIECLAVRPPVTSSVTSTASPSVPPTLMPRPLDVASTIGGAVGGVMSIILLIILIIVIGITLKCYCIKVKKNKELQLTMQNGTSMDSIESGIDNSRYVTNNNGVLQKKLTSKMLNIDKNQMLTLETSGLLVDNDSLRLLDCIGEGEFGLVYKAHLFDDDGMPTYVAVKTLKGSYDQNEISELLTESLRMKQLLHPNVMGLVGVSINAGPAPFIILPFMAGGSLLSYLKRNRTTILLNGDVIDEGQEVEIKLLSMCLQIAKGMEYISSQNLIHRDLAARNCMIDHQGIIKVSDFGLSKNLYEKMYFRQDKTEGVKLPIKWMAIESINDGVFSEKTDVWSFGITCWEIFSGGKGPFGGISPMNLSNLLEQGQRLNKPNNNACSNNTYDNVMMVCWHSSPDDRPTFAECVVSIGNTLTSLADYLDFNQFKLETTDTNGTDINGTDDDKENLT